MTSSTGKGRHTRHCRCLHVQMRKQMCIQGGQVRVFRHEAHVLATVQTSTLQATSGVAARREQHGLGARCACSPTCHENVHTHADGPCRGAPPVVLCKGHMKMIVHTCGRPTAEKTARGAIHACPVKVCGRTCASQPPALAGLNPPGVPQGSHASDGTCKKRGHGDQEVRQLVGWRLHKGPTEHVCLIWLHVPLG